jgi:hypothetical protein
MGSRLLILVLISHPNSTCHQNLLQIGARQHTWVCEIKPLLVFSRDGYRHFFVCGSNDTTGVIAPPLVQIAHTSPR